MKKEKEMYEAFLEFPEGWGGVRKTPFREGGMDIFWNYTFSIFPKKIHELELTYGDRNRMWFDSMGM